MKSLFFSLVVLLASFNGHCQSNTIVWQKSYGGSGVDESFDVQTTNDGGYVLAGGAISNDGDVSGNHGNEDCWVLKTDPKGAIQWQKSLGGTNIDYIKSIAQTKDSGYIIAASSRSNNGDITSNFGASDYWVVKLNKLGVIQWQKTFGGGLSDNISAIIEVASGGYIVAGSGAGGGMIIGNHGNLDYWILKLDDSGGVQWQQSYGGSKHDHLQRIKATKDGGYIMVGATLSANGDVSQNHGSYDYWLLKIDGEGKIQWQKSYGGTGVDWAYDVRQVPSGGFIIAGATGSNNGDVTANHSLDSNYSDYWIVRVNDTGAIVWQKTLGGSANDEAQSIELSTDGGFMIAGTSTSLNGDVTDHHGAEGDGDYWIVKLNSVGTIQWKKSYGGAKMDLATAIRSTKDGGYVITGTSESIDGDVTANHGSSDFWLMKLQGNPASVVQMHKEAVCTAYPIPATGKLYIKSFECGIICLLNAAGENVGQYDIQKGLTEISIEFLNAGLYIAQFTSRQSEATLFFKVNIR